MPAKVFSLVGSGGCWEGGDSIFGENFGVLQLIKESLLLTQGRGWAATESSRQFHATIVARARTGRVFACTARAHVFVVDLAIARQTRMRSWHASPYVLCGTKSLSAQVSGITFTLGLWRLRRTII